MKILSRKEFEEIISPLLPVDNENTAEDDQEIISTLFKKLAIGREVIICRKEVLSSLNRGTQEQLADVGYKANEWLFEQHNDKKGFIVKFMDKILNIPLEGIFEIIVDTKEIWSEKETIQACKDADLPQEDINLICKTRQENEVS